jgi:geranylgeranyl diphosphate synthase type II
MSQVPQQLDKRPVSWKTAIRERSDLSKRKATYPSVLGVEECKRIAKELGDWGVDALKQFGPEAEPLREIARFIIAREY